MRHSKVLCEVGEVSKVLLPTPYAMTNRENPLNLTTDMAKIAETFSNKRSTDKNADSPGDLESKSPDISGDPNVKVLSEVYLPDVVICTSAAKTIFNNDPTGALDRNWEIPFTVRVVGPSDKTVILIDKPLPPKQGMSAQKKRAWFMKKAAFCKMVGPFTRCGH